MNISLFNRHYWVRRFGEQRTVRGYVTTGFRDFVASLNVHPSATDQQLEAPEGERRVKRLEAHGTDVLITANQETGTKGDLLWYHGEWYECTNAQEWDHTVLNHLNYSFILVPHDAAGSIDLQDPPEMDPDRLRPGDGVYTEDGQLVTATADRLGFVMVPAGSGLNVAEDGSLSLDSGTVKEVLERFGREEEP